ncbi:MAG: hypothetical protein Q4E12_01080 [Coriobacteriia bacterium]|nr:hypothetical protein [Coriobacteriia bacterium]
MRYPDRVKTTQDLTALQWRECYATPGTSGSFLKATQGSGTATVYYKASTFDRVNGFFGHECVNELVAARLMDILGVPHARYSLVHARVRVEGIEYETWVNASPSYRHSAETKQAFSQFYDQFALRGESPLALCDRMGWSAPVRQMLLVDYLIINQDRHGANVEVLHLKDGRKRLAPVFDCGNSFVFSCYDVEEAIRAFDPLVDAVGTNFIGSKRLVDNLVHVSPGVVNSLRPEHRPRLFAGLDGVLPDYHLEKMWDILWKRWCVYAGV